MTFTRPPTDTSPDALAVQLQCLRNMTPQQRLAQTLTLSTHLKQMALVAIRRRHPDWDEARVRLLFIDLTYGEKLADSIRSWPRKLESMSDRDDLIDALAPVVHALRSLGVRHFVGGSVASSFHGATRSTMDVDVVCELSGEHVSSFVELLRPDYYISEMAVWEAVQRKSCFNAIHLPTSFKVDVFISRNRPFDQQAMRRAILHSLGEERPIEVPIATAEDSIISKLEWYRLTDETSQRQWDDVSKLVQLLGDALDVEYLTAAAQSVGVSDLLEKLLSQP